MSYTRTEVPKGPVASTVSPRGAASTGADIDGVGGGEGVFAIVWAVADDTMRAKDTAMTEHRPKWAENEGWRGIMDGTKWKLSANRTNGRLPYLREI